MSSVPVTFIIWEAFKKETNRRPRKRNQYLYVRSIGPGCWGTCPTVTQGSERLSRKIPGTALWTSSARTVQHRHLRWIFCHSEPFLEDQKWRNRRERVLDCMEGDRIGRLMHTFASFQSRDLHQWSSSGGQWTSALLSEPLFVTHTTILWPVCTFQTPAHFFFSASGSFLF